MKIRLLNCWIVILLTLVFGAFLSPAYAHVLKTDGEVGAVVHIDPEDDPIVGKETTIYFDIKDKSGRFKIEDCDCWFVVKKAGHEVFSESLSGFTASYNFSERNIYTLEFIGKSKKNDSFQPFELSYDLRVEREEGGQTDEAEENSASSQTIKFIVFGVIALLVGFGIYFLSSRKK